VIEKLQKRYGFSPAVKMIDGGTAGFGLVTGIEGCIKMLVVDAVKAGNEPEVIFIGIEPEDMYSWGFDLTPCIQDKMPKLVSLVIEQLRADGITVTEKT